MPQCRGKTDAGKRCTRQLAEGDWCWDHGPNDFDEVDPEGFATQAAFARIIDRSSERVRQYRQKGVLELEKSPHDGKQKLHVGRSLEALMLHSDISRSSLPFDLYEKHVGPLEAGASDEDDEGSLQHQKLVAEVNLKVQQARLARIKADEAEGDLVSLDEVEKAWGDIAQQCHDKLLTIPDRLSAQFAGMTSEREIYDTLVEELKMAMIDIANGLDSQ